MRYYRDYFHWVCCQARTFSDYTKKQKREYVLLLLKDRDKVPKSSKARSPGVQLGLFS